MQPAYGLLAPKSKACLGPAGLRQWPLLKEEEIVMKRTPFLTGFAALSALGLAACSEPAERTFETRTEDRSGGEFIVTEADREGVDVELPSTPMTPVPPEQTRPVEGAEVMDQTG
jgi:hypothetical protein